MDLRSRRVELYVESLAIDGAGRLDRAALGRAIERELGRLLAEGGGADRAAPAPRPGDSVPLPHPPRADAIGQALARTLHRKLGP